MRGKGRKAIEWVPPPRGRRWRPAVLLWLLLIGSVIIQGSLFSAFPGGNFKPDLVLIVVVFINVRRGFGSGWPTALAAGFLEDIFSAGMLGLGAISLALTARGVSWICRSLYREHFRTRMVMVVLAVAVSNLIYYLLLAIFRAPLPWSGAWSGAIWPSLWQTTLAAPCWLWLTGKILNPRVLSRRGN